MAYKWQIAERAVFNQRFGSMSASELRKVLFAVFLSGDDADGGMNDYAIGRKLGLTATQVKNLRVGANLLLEGDEDTKQRARINLALSFKRSLVEYQKQTERIVVQIDDPIALNYLNAILVEEGLFRSRDVSNGHIAVPADRLKDFVRIVFSELSEKELEDAIGRLLPASELEVCDKDSSSSTKLATILKYAESATTIAVNVLNGIGSLLLGMM